MTQSESDRQKALQDLSVIRETIQRSTGSTYFLDFLEAAGSLVLLFGLATVVASGLTYAIFEGLLRVPRPTLAVIVVWAAVFALTGVVKTYHINRRARHYNLSWWQYSRLMLTPSFLHAVLPIGLGAVSLTVYLLRTGQAGCVPAALTLYLGAVYAAFGTLYLARVVVCGGYELTLLGAVGLLCLTDHPVVYIALVGALFVVHGTFFMFWPKRSRWAINPPAGPAEPTDG